MDEFFEHLPAYRVVTCRSCAVGVWPGSLVAHLRGKAHQLTLQQARYVAQDLAGRGFDLCRPHEFKTPAGPVRAIPGFPIFRNGQQCILNPENCTYICRDERVLREHWRSFHAWSLCQGRGGSGPRRTEHIAERLELAVRRPLLCQRLFSSGSGSQFFEIVFGDEQGCPAIQALSTKDIVLAKLADLEHAQQQAGDILVATSSAKEVSPWLQLTRWLGYLNGHSLRKVCKLTWIPQSGQEAVLAEICASVDRLVDQAITAVREDRINPFDQMRINSFLQRPKISDKPLAFKLQAGTIRTYRSVWQRLLCFIYRTLEHDCSPSLRHRLTNAQLVHYTELVGQVESLHSTQESPDPPHHAIQAARIGVDRSCLNFCISLLDHTLNGDIYESAVVGYFAAVAIDYDKMILREAHNFGSVLSGFVKIAQMLVIQRALVGVENGEAMHPSDLIDEMRDRFLVYGSRSPFSWACRLRAYAKKVRDTTTSLGYISWSEDGTAVSYKDVKCLTVTRLCEFVRAQIEYAQVLLEQLLFITSEDNLRDLGIKFLLHRVGDNACESNSGWNFLRLDSNRAGPLPARDTWLLERVLDHEHLREEFTKDWSSKKVVWKPTIVDRYKDKVEQFLEILLLLVHITGGQPARGTEILSLRHMNTISGYHRNIFADHGMINTVTTYHKGYNVTGSVKIIHRFLPKEVGELVVFYLWLVLPFCQKLDLLVFQRKEQPSAFLWPKPGGRDCWSSERLSRVLRRQFRDSLGVSISISVWRHLAIAISRKHLACGGFKRDYDADDTAFDNQSTHSTRTAGSVYARGLEEAAGHVEERRTTYRKISHEWHSLLGFGPQGLPMGDMFLQPTDKCTKYATGNTQRGDKKRGMEMSSTPRNVAAKRLKLDRCNEGLSITFPFAFHRQGYED